MESSSQMLGGKEECHSSESGWTMYIGSPTYDDDDGDENRHSAADGNDAGSDDDDDDDKNEATRDEDSDDSMASDASSGPSHQGHPCGSRKYGHGPADFRNDGEENDSKYRLGEKANKQKDKENQSAQRIKKEKEEKAFEADKVTASGQSSSKVRKNLWRGKGK